MAQEIVKGDLVEWGLGYVAKLEEGKIKVSVEQDLTKLVDKAAEAIPGDSPIEKLIVELSKQAIRAI